MSSSPSEQSCEATAQRRRTRTYTEAERELALRVVGECGGNLSRAARRLGLDVSLLWRWRARAAARLARATPAAPIVAPQSAARRA